MYLLDSNIFIYFIQGNQKVIDFLDELGQEKFYISIITRFEVLMGASKEKIPTAKVEEYLDYCENISLDKNVVREALHLSKGNLKFKDLLIAATAKTNKLTLLTADQDFQKLDGVKVEKCPF